MGGLALLDINYVTESRLSEKGREVLLIRTLLENKVSKGLGIDENTAFVVKDPLTGPVGTVYNFLVCKLFVFVFYLPQYIFR